MHAPVPSFEPDRALDYLMRFLAVEGITGQEEAIGNAVKAELRKLGVPPKAISHDGAHAKIPLPTQTGNLIVRLPGTLPGPRRLFMTHLDTVPLCAGAVPVRKGNRVVPAGNTALGGDNRTGVACLVHLLDVLFREKISHPPLTFLFTVREESGLWGARFVQPDDLGNPTLGFNVDGRSPRDLTIGAVGAERWEAVIRGRASHAGVHPEKGISATLVAALALAKVHAGGWFGKVVHGKLEGTSNVGSIGDPNDAAAGRATNVVTDLVVVRGESRSHDAPFHRKITLAYRDAFREAAASVTDDRGRTAKVKFTARCDYYPFHLRENSPVVQIAQAAAERAGWTPELRTTRGGLDANWLVRHGIPTITFGAGQHEPHTVDEFVDVREFLEGCRFALALATQS